MNALAPLSLRLSLMTMITLASLSTATAADKKPAAAREAAAASGETDGEWTSLFDGKSLEGWQASENKKSCFVEDGTIVVQGPRSHLFYVGDVGGGDFRNFEFKCEVLTRANANSGIYFHTKYQERGWPNLGYEAQVNNTHRDPRKTGGLYAVQDVSDPPAKDGEWFEYHIIVRGKQIVLKINGETTVDYTEPDDLDRPNRQLATGTFALQAHDPGSRVAYRKLQVKVLP